MRKIIIAILVTTILFGGSSCGAQVQETNNLENNLKQINKGINKFAKLKNGTLEVKFLSKAENNAVKEFDTVTGTSITIFISHKKGYDYIEETKVFNEENGECQYYSTKQVKGKLYNAFPIEQSAKEKLKAYEWRDISGSNHYEPNGALRMMAISPKLLGNIEYIKEITNEREGRITKYTLKTNDAFAKYLKETVYRPEDNYNVIEQREIYWIDGDGLLIKHQTYGEFEYTIDGIPDTYVCDMTVELTGYNDKSLKEIDDELIN